MAKTRGTPGPVRHRGSGSAVRSNDRVVGRASLLAGHMRFRSSEPDPTRRERDVACAIVGHLGGVAGWWSVTRGWWWRRQTWGTPCRISGFGLVGFEFSDGELERRCGWLELWKQSRHDQR